MDLAYSWWALVLRGVIAVLFGLAAFVWPGITLLVLVLLFGSYALVDGIFALATALGSSRRDGHWWPLILEGLVGIAVGLVALFWPGITALALLYLIAAWAVLTGVLEILAALRLRRELEREWLLALAGVASVLFGLVLAGYPEAGAVAMVWIIGAYGLLFGILLIALGLRLRRPVEA